MQTHSIQKGDTYSFTANLQYTLTATLASGSKIASLIKPGYMLILEGSIDATITGTGIPNGTTIAEACTDGLSITLSQAATVSGAQDLTVTTGSFAGKEVRFEAYKDPASSDPPLIALSTTDPVPQIAVDSGNLKASIKLTATDTNIVVSKKGLTLTAMVRAIDANNSDTVATFGLTIVPAKSTPTLPEC